MTDLEAVAFEQPPEARVLAGLAGDETRGVAVAGLAQQPAYIQFWQLRHTLPVEDTDGEFVRIAVASQTMGGTFSDGKGEPSQVSSVSHGCPPARFRNVQVGVRG